MSAFNPSLSRRDLLRFTSLAAVGAGVGVGGLTATSSPARAGTGWPGNQSGRIYLGCSAQDFNATLSRTGPVGLHRTFHQWSGSTEAKAIADDHAANRLPWVSFKPPSSPPGGWTAIASGHYDNDIRARARRYAGLSKPVIATFNHEPHTDSGSPSDFAAAWCRVHDIMASETGLKNVASVPIAGEWIFNPVNRRNEPGDYVTSGVLARCSFLGLDLYQNRSGGGFAERVGRVISWLNSQGYPNKMVGIGETGCTEDYGSPSGAQWWTDSWNWAVANRDRIAAISYFNSLHNNNSGNNWLLWQSTSKLAAFQASLRSSTATRL